MNNTEIGDQKPPDESTPLLPHGNALLCTSEPQVTEVTVQENAHSEGETTEPHTNQSDKPWAGLPTWLGWTALSALLLGISTMNLDNSFIQTAYLKIGSDLGNQQLAAWFIQAYQIGVTASRPFHSFFSDSYGRMKPLIAGYCFFAFGLALCGLSTSLLALVFSRLVVGIGSAAMWMLVSVILNDTVERSKRAAWESVTKMAVIAGQVGGELLGGPFVEGVGWQPAFAVPFLLTLVCIILGWWKLRKTPINEPVPVSVDQEDLQRTNILWDLVLGGTLLVIFATCLCMIFLFVSAEISWREPWVYLVLFSFVVSGPWFVWHQWKTRTKPLVNFRVICRSPRWQIFLAIFFREGATVGLQFLIPWYSAATGKGPWSRTWLMMALSFGFVAGALVANALITKWKFLNHGFIIFGTICALAGCVMYFRWRYSHSLWEIGAYIFVFGLGSGASSATYLVGLLEVTRSEDQATIYGSDKLGTDIAVLSSIATSNYMLPAILAKDMRSNLTPLLPAREIEKLIEFCRSDQKCVNKLSLAVREAVQLSLTQACMGVLILHIVCVVLSIGCACLTKDIELTKGNPGR